jgi:threonine aldolase
VGSLLAGTESFIAEAKRVRKAFGGGMRQAGILAAAGLLALREGPALLALDHERARRLARGLAELPWCTVDLAATETNIVMADLTAGTPPALLAHLQAQGVLASQYGPRRIRFVLHRDVDDEHVQRALSACRSFVPSAPASAASLHS